MHTTAGHRRGCVEVFAVSREKTDFRANPAKPVDSPHAPNTDGGTGYTLIIPMLFSATGAPPFLQSPFFAVGSSRGDDAIPRDLVYLEEG